jgi:hypothetical protein
MVSSWAGFLGRSVPWAIAIALPFAAVPPSQAQTGVPPTALTAPAAEATQTTGQQTTGLLAANPPHTPPPRPHRGPDNEGHGQNGPDPNPNCTLIVPDHPLSAEGLTTPYQLIATNPANGPCHEANPMQSAFVEATIIDPHSGKLSVYRPLVVDKGTPPAAPPVPVQLPKDAEVGIWFGFQGNVLVLAGDRRRCVDGVPGSPFGQFAYCNAPNFFDVTNEAIHQDKLHVPVVRDGRDGKPCPTTRDFSVVDQDQSDNLTTRYLALANGLIAQDTPQNRQRFPGATVLTNASDNALLTTFIDPALGCQPFTTLDLTTGRPGTSLALNELQAAASEVRIQPVALVPPNDPMVLVNGRFSEGKTNLYRVGVDQPPLNPWHNELIEVARTYCRNLVTIAPPRLILDKPFYLRAPSPDPAAANNLFTFLAQRLNNSFVQLGCTDLLHQGPPFELITDQNGVVVDARLNNH